MSELATLDAGLAGLRESLERLERTAQRMAPRAPAGDLAGDMVELIRSRRSFQANAAVVRTADEARGTLLDLLV